MNLPKNRFLTTLGWLTKIRQRVFGRRLVFLFIFLVPLLMAAEIKTNYAIVGVKKKLRDNISARLDEIAENKPLSLMTNEELISQIAQAISPYGYFKPSITLARSQNGKDLKIVINPGPRLAITHLSIIISGEGKNNAEIIKVLHQIELKPGDPLKSAKYEEAKQSLLDAAENQGYLHASYTKAEILIDETNYTSTINLVLDTGPQFYFGQVQFDPTYISPQLLHRYIPFHYGQAYSTEQILALNSALSSSGYFKNVIVKPNLDSNQQVIPIDVHLQKAHRVNYSLGLGFGTDTGIRGRLGYHVVPVNRSGDKFNAVALGSLKENRLQAQYIMPGKNPLTDQYELFGSLSNLNYDAGYSNSMLASLAQRHNETRFQRVLSLNGLYERFNYDNAPKEEKTTVYPKINLTWMNKSNDLFSPTGYNVSFSGLGATRLFLSEINFAQASIDAKAAITLEKLRTRLYFHSIQGVTFINDINQLPLSLALLLGGADNLKAYSYNSIGPGKILSYAGIEIQKETVKNWYFISFFDSGDVYQPSLKEWNNDVGIGLMWVSPVGPIKIAVAEPVDTHFNHSSSKPKLVINMGPDL